jgi:hypothetical protein
MKRLFFFLSFCILAIALTAQPNLIVQTAAVTPASFANNTSITYTATVKNTGTLASVACTFKYFYSSDAIYDAGDVLQGSTSVGILPATTGTQNTSTGPIIFNVVGASGAKFILFKVDDPNVNTESNENDNVLAVPITIGSTGCTLAAPLNPVANTIAPTTANVSWTTVAGATGYEVSYKLATATVWDVANYSLCTSTNLTLLNLTCLSNYQFRVRAMCSATSLSTNYSAIVAFSTSACPPACSTVAYSQEPVNNSNTANVININVATSLPTYDLGYIFGVNRNHVKNPGFNPFNLPFGSTVTVPLSIPPQTTVTNYQNFLTTIMKNHSAMLSNQKHLYRWGGTMSDGFAGTSCDGNTFPLIGWQHDNIDQQGDGGYPYDNINNYIAEAEPDKLNADLTLTINFGSATPLDAKNLVIKLKNSGKLSKVKYFEMGNEISLSTQFGHGPNTVLQGTTVCSCPTCPVQINQYPPLSSTTYNLADKCSTPLLYATNVANFINEMIVGADGSCLRLKIGLVVGHDTQMAWAVTSGIGDDTKANIQTMITELKSKLGANESKVDLFLITHGYGGYPLINGLVLMPNAGHPDNFSGNTSEMTAKSLLATAYNLEKRVKNNIYSNVSCKSDNLFATNTWKWNGQPIKLALTENSTYLQDQDLKQSTINLKHSVTEALFSADHMINAAKLDFESCVAHTLHHNSVNGFDDLFYGPFNQSTNYGSLSATNLTTKATYRAHQFLNDYMYTKVVPTNDQLSTLYKVKDFQIRGYNAQNEATPIPATLDYFYPALSFVMTQKAIDPTKYAFVVINRSNLPQTISTFDMQNMPAGNYQVDRKTIKSSNGLFTSTTFADDNLTISPIGGILVSNNKLTIPSTIIAPLSINVFQVGKLPLAYGSEDRSEEQINVSRTISVNPNPNEGNCILTINSKVSERVNVQITDLLGKLCQSKSIAISEGINEVPLMINDCGEGIYFVTVINPITKVKSVTKIIKN